MLNPNFKCSAIHRWSGVGLSVRAVAFVFCAWVTTCPLVSQEPEAAPSPSKADTAKADTAKADIGKDDSAEPHETSLEVRNAILKTFESTSIAAQTAGIIVSIDVKEGYTVKTGQELGRIRDDAVRLQVNRAKAAMEVAKRKKNDDIDERLAKKSQAVAMNEYQRAVAANQRVRDTYPLNEIDRLKLVADRSQLEVERASHLRSMAALEASISETEYEQALEQQERHRLVSLVPGIVVSIEKHVGEWVEPGTPLLKIERIDRLRVEGFVSAMDSMRDLIGQTATVSLASGQGTFQVKGKVVFVSPSVDPILATARVFIEVENEKYKLRPGLGVRATIHLQP